MSNPLRHLHLNHCKVAMRIYVPSNRPFTSKPIPRPLVRLNKNAPQFAALLKRNPTTKDYVRHLIYYPHRLERRHSLSQTSTQRMFMGTTIQVQMIKGTGSTTPKSYSTTIGPINEAIISRLLARRKTSVQARHHNTTRPNTSSIAQS